MYVGGTSFCGVNAIGPARASCNVIAVSALWLIKLALARTPPPSILYSGMTMTVDVLSIFLLDWRGVIGVGQSGCINAGPVLVILGRAPGVLLWVCRWCMSPVVIKFRFAVGSHVFMLAGASDIRCIVPMGACSLMGLSITSSLVTLCSSSLGGARMALIALPRLLMSRRPLVVPAAIFVSVCNSLVSALRCAVGLRLGTWQCCGKSSADPKIWYARVSGTKCKLHQ